MNEVPRALWTWDIVPLNSSDDPIPILSKGKCGTGDCSKTVTVDDGCYKAEEVNYVLWGKINRLCHDFYQTGKMLPIIPGPIFRDWLFTEGGRTVKVRYGLPSEEPYTLDDALSLVTKYRFVRGVITLTHPGITGRQAWTKAGWYDDFTYAEEKSIDSNKCPACRTKFNGVLTFRVGVTINFWNLKDSPAAIEELAP